MNLILIIILIKGNSNLDREAGAGARFRLPSALHRCAAVAARLLLYSHPGGEPLHLPLVHLVVVASHLVSFVYFLVLGTKLCFRHVYPQAAQVHDMGRPKTWIPCTSLLSTILLVKYYNFLLPCFFIIFLKISRSSSESCAAPFAVFLAFRLRYHQQLHRDCHSGRRRKGSEGLEPCSSQQGQLIP